MKCSTFMSFNRHLGTYQYHSPDDPISFMQMVHNKVRYLYTKHVNITDLCMKLNKENKL
jgi:hypothetical protein